MKIALRVNSCKQCPARQYGSGGRYDCTAVDAPLPDVAVIPVWCPLPDDPAQLAGRVTAALDSAKRVLAVATQEAADLETTPARLRELLTVAANQLARCT